MAGKIFRTLTVVVLVAVVGLAGTYAVWSARDTARTQAEEALLLRARTIASAVSTAVSEDVQAVVVTGGRGKVASAVLLANRQRSLRLIAGYFQPAAPFISHLMATHPRIDAVSIYDRSGRLVARAPADGSVIGRRFAQQEYFKNAINHTEPQISKLFVQLGVPKGPVEAYSARILLQKYAWGVIIATTPLSTFDTLATANAEPGETVRIYNATGEVVSPSSEASGRSYLSDAAIGPLLRGRAVVKRAGSMVVASAPAPAIGWTATVSEPMSHVYDKAGDETVRLSWLMGAITFAALGLSVFALWRRGASS